MGELPPYNERMTWAAKEVAMRRGALITLAIVALGCWTSVPTVRAAGPSRQLDEEAIRQFVLDANSDAKYSAAYRTGNTDVLRESWGGEVLLTMQEDIANLRFAGQYLDPQLEGMDFERIEELGPGRVRVVTVERWLARLYQIGGAYLGYQRQTVENRYLVVRDGDAWHIIEADQEIRGGDPVFRPGEPDQGPAPGGQGPE
jgi:hypothetical protein